MATSQTITATLTANGSTASVRWSGVYLGHFYAVGTFGSGTITLEYSLDGGSSWLTADADNLVFTAAGRANFQLPNCLLRITLSGATSPDIDTGVEKIANTSR